MHSGNVQAQTQGQMPVPAQRQMQRQLYEQGLALAYGLPKLQAQGQLLEQVRALAPWTGKSVGAVPGQCHDCSPGKSIYVARQYESEGHAYCSKRTMVGV